MTMTTIMMTMKMTRVRIIARSMAMIKPKNKLREKG